MIPLLMLFFLLLHIFVSFRILFTSPLRTLYFGLELQWMLLTIFFIISTSVCRGLFNYLILNGILSISLILGLLLSNSLFFILACFGKIGYFPFLLVLASLWYSSSYLFLMIDLINKWAYFGSFLVIFHLYILLNSFSYWFTLIHFLILMFFIKLILTIKHLILISSLINYLFIILLILLDHYLFSFSYLSYYSITSILIILFLSFFISWFFMPSFWFTCLLAGSAFNPSSLCFYSSFPHSKGISLTLWMPSFSFYSFFPIFLSFSFSSLLSSFSSLLSNPSFFSSSLSGDWLPVPFTWRMTSANSLTDLINLNFFILLSYSFFLFFLFLLISLFPTIMFLNKLFSLNLLDNHSLSLLFNLVIFLLFIFQAFFLRSISSSIY